MLPAPAQLASPTGVLLIGLFVGHIFADFLVQTERVAALKGERGRVMLLHGLLTFATHTVFVLPYMSRLLCAGLLLLALYHITLDALRARLPFTRELELPALLADQALHLAGVIALWYWLCSADVVARAWLPFDPRWMPPAARLALLAAGFVFNAKGGNAIVRALLARFPTVMPDPGATKDLYATGRVIGTLERFLVFGLVLLEQWLSVGLVLTAKSIARHKDLEQRPFADYYLIGTLTSLLVGVASALLVRRMLGS